MTLVAIRQKLHRYIDTAQEKKVKAIFSMVEDEINESAEIWTNEFLNELNKRTSDFESGKVKGSSWNTVKKEARKLTKLR